MLDNNNWILTADSYKVNHYLEIPDNIEYTYVTVVPRKPSKYTDKIVAMGHTLIADTLQEIRITQDMIDEAEIETKEQGFTFNRKGWEIIVNEFDGYLPLAMYGVKEGTVVKAQTPIMTFVNTDPRFAWLPGYIESWVQSIAWKMTTVASICKKVRDTITDYCILTDTPVKYVDYMCHFFGDRAADSPQAAIMAGIAHAALFNGSDCLQANRYIKKLYHTNKSYLSSIEATEHFVMMTNSENKDDYAAAEMIVDRLCNTGNAFMSVVIDTYDSRRFVKEYIGTRLKDRILNAGGRLICRPDSNDPTIEPGLVGKDLEDTFGVTINKKGYKVLHPSVGVIQGDGIRIDTFESVLKGWIDAGFSMDNFALGMGSGISHDGARDDFSFSVKATAVYTDGKWKPLLKDPKTDPGKRSLSGLVKCDDNLETFVDTDTRGVGKNWKMWYHNVTKTFDQSFDEVRELARK